jgi:ferredoxin
MRVTIDTQRCTGHGRCYTVAPALFTDDERGFGQVIGDGEVPPGHEDMGRSAVDACPEQAVAYEPSPDENA